MNKRNPQDFCVRCWAIMTPRKQISAPSIRTTRASCIDAYVRLPGNASVDRAIKRRWPKLHKWGWRCVTVWISIYEPKARKAGE